MMSEPVTSVLVTGANGGLGFALCRRLIDDFLSNKLDGSLNIIFTTRSERKGSETLRLLKAHLATTYGEGARERIAFQPENVELTNLLSVCALARKLRSSNISHLDAVVCNAGMAGWSGLDWPRPWILFFTDIRNSTTFPPYKLGIAGLITAEQFRPDSTKGLEPGPEPPLGQIFTSNVFGHYMLIHWLMPLLQACPQESPGKIIWVSSVEARAKHFTFDDFQGLKSDAAYEHSKRMTDIMALTYDRPSVAARASRGFYNPSSSLMPRHSGLKKSDPTMHVAHPGICPTTIISLPWIIHQCYVLGIYAARLAGAPWSTCSTYTAALVFTWLIFTSSTDVAQAEQAFSFSDSTSDSSPRATTRSRKTSSGSVKWGTGVTRLGKASVQPTEVDGWGLNGSGKPFSDKWWARPRRGRHPEAKDATREETEDFVELGTKVWQAMEELRKEWEDRIERYEQREEKVRQHGK